MLRIAPSENNFHSSLETGDKIKKVINLTI